MMRGLVCTVLFLFCTIASSGQIFRHLKADKGLPGNTVFHCYADRSGIIWFCTDRGLTRYNGRDFKTFTVADGLPDNTIFNAYEDNYHRLWLYCYNGRACFLYKDSVFQAHNSPLLSKLLTNSYLNVMSDMPDGSLLFGYAGGFVLKAGPGGKTVLQSNYLLGNFPLLIAYNNGHTEIMFAQGNTPYAHILLPELVHYPVSQAIQCGGRIFFADMTGVHMVMDGKERWNYCAPDIRNRKITDLFYDSTSGKLFCSTLSGLLVLDINKDWHQELLPAIAVTSVAMDHSGNYWVSTSQEGVYYIGRELEGTRLLADVSGSKFIKPAGSSYIFFQRQNSIHLFQSDTAGGIPAFCNIPCALPEGMEPFYYDRTFFILRKGLPPARTVVSSATGRVVINEYYKNAFQLNDGSIALIPKNNYFYLVKQDVAGRLSVDATKLPFTIRQGHVINDKAFLLADTALYMYDIGSKHLHNIPGISIMAADVEQMQHTGTSLWLFRTNGTALIIDTRSSNLSLKEIACKGKFLVSAYALPDGRMLVNTTDVPCIVDLRHDTNTDTAFHPVYYPFPDCAGTEFRVRGDSIYYLGDNQLLAFHYSLLNKYSIAPAFRVKSVRVNNVFTSADTVLAMKNEDGCNINIRFDPLYFGMADAYLQSRIIRKEKQDSWETMLDKELNAYLGFYGKAELQVRMCTPDGRKSPVWTMPLELFPPFYHTNWFYVLMICLIVLFIVFLLYLNNRWSRTRFRKRFREMQQEHRAVNSLLNPHFVFNAINNIQHLVSQESKDMANIYLATLSRLMRQNLENLEHHLVPLAGELELIENYISLQRLRFNNNIHLMISRNIRNGMDDIYIPPLTIHTFIENAVVHGYDPDLPGLEISLSVDLSADNYLIIIIRDNGRGLNAVKRPGDASHERTSVGIRIVKQRLERLAGFYKHQWHVSVNDRSITSGARGTEVTIILYAGYKKLVKDAADQL